MFISAEVDEFVETELPQVVVLLEEGCRDHVEHALAAEDLCLDVAQEDPPQEGEDDERKDHEEHNPQLYEEDG
jgi:hypothetical protein